MTYQYGRNFTGTINNVRSNHIYYHCTFDNVIFENVVFENVTFSGCICYITFVRCSGKIYLENCPVDCIEIDNCNFAEFKRIEHSYSIPSHIENPPIFEHVTIDRMNDIELDHECVCGYRCKTYQELIGHQNSYKLLGFLCTMFMNGCPICGYMPLDNFDYQMLKHVQIYSHK